MDKDKEAVALFQNKRQEIRCSQLINAVNKAQNLRERELLHETHYFKSKLWKLVQRRKELRLDPVRTRELEVYLNPGLRSKANKQSNVPTPNKLGKSIPAETKTFKTVANSSDAKEDIFVTKTLIGTRIDLEVDLPEVSGANNFSRYPVLPAPKPITKQTNNNTILQGDKGAQKQLCNVVGSTSQNRETTLQQGMAAREKLPSIPGQQMASRENFRTPLHASDSQVDSAVNSKPVNDILARRASFLKRSVSEMNLKIVNSKQWINILSDSPPSNEKLDGEQSRRQSSFAAL